MSVIITVTNGGGTGSGPGEAPDGDGRSVRRDRAEPVAAVRTDGAGRRLAGGVAFALGLWVAAGPLAGVVGLAIAVGVTVGGSVPLAIVAGTLAVVAVDPSPTTVDALAMGTGTGLLVAADGGSRRVALVGVGVTIVFGSTLGVALTNAAVWVGAVALVAVAGLAGYAVYRYGLVRLDLVEVAS
jgi:hypothetical protein